MRIIENTRKITILIGVILFIEVLIGGNKKAMAEIEDKKADSTSSQNTASSTNNTKEKRNNLESMPTFKYGGMEGFNEFIAHNLMYPKGPAERGIQGTVMVKFTVESTGEITNVKVVEEDNPVLDTEAIRVVKSSQGLWTSATKKSKDVKHTLTVPVIFKLKPETFKLSPL